MLARAVSRHEHAVQREILQLGYRKSDWFTSLSTYDMIAIVIGADHNSALFYALNDGFGLTDHLLATMYEHQNGFEHRIARPGVTDLRPKRMPDIRDPNTKRLTFDPMTIDQFETRRAAYLKGA